MNLLNSLINKLEKTPLIYFYTAFFLITFFVYSNSLFNGFVWDDEEQVINNQIIKNVANIPYLFTSSTFNTGGAGLSGQYYKPLMPLTFSIVNAIFGINAFGFHLASVFFHFLNATLLFIFLKKILELGKYKDTKAIPFLLSLIFIIHPANSESVAYISSTQELLYTFFLLLSLIFTVYYLLGKSKFFVPILLFIFLSLLSKESGIVGIPIIIILIFLLKKEALKRMMIGLSATFLFYLILRFPIAKTPFLSHSNIIPIADTSLINRILTIPYEIFSYLRVIFFPKDLFVAQYWVINSIFDLRFFVPVLLIIFLLISLKLKIKKVSKISIFYFAWLLCSFSIILNIYPLDMTFAERWLYGPFIPFLGLISIAYNNLEKKQQQIFLLILLLISPLLMIRTIIRNSDWKDNLSLFSKDIKFTKESFASYNNLGVASFRNNNQQDAKKYFQKSIELSPNWWTPYNNLGAVYQREGDIKRARELYAKSIEKGNYYLAYENLARLKYTTESPYETIKFVNDALKYLPNNEILNKVGSMSFIRIEATESARPLAEKAYLINPSQENYYLLQLTSR